MTVRSNLVGAAVLALALATSTVQAPKKVVVERRDVVTKVAPRESKVGLGDPAASALVRLSAIIAVAARLRGR